MRLGKRAKPQTLACPTCGSRFDSHIAVGRAAEKRMSRPLPGCTLLCGICGEICVMQADNTARRMTEAECQGLPQEIVQMLAVCEEARQDVRRKNGKNPFRTEETRP